MTASLGGKLLLTLGVLMLGAAVLAWPAMSMLAARERALTAMSLLDQAARSERELTRLKASLPKTTPSRAAGGEDLAARFQTVLRDAGLAANLVAEVTPQVNGWSPGNLPSASWRRQSVQVRLQPMPLADIGLVLERWRAAHPEWTISPITLSASERQPDSAAAAPITFAATLLLNASSLETVDSSPRPSIRQ